MTKQLCAPEKLVDLLWNMTEKEWQSLDETILSIKTVQTIDENTRIKLISNSYPWPVWSRQTLYIERKIQVKGGWWIVSFSTTHDSEPEKVGTYVRSTLHFDAYGFKHSEGGNTRLFRLLHHDPNGYVPGSVLSRNATRITGIMHFLRKNGVTENTNKSPRK